MHSTYMYSMRSTFLLRSQFLILQNGTKHVPTRRLSNVPADSIRAAAQSQPSRGTHPMALLLPTAEAGSGRYRYRDAPSPSQVRVALPR